MRPLTKDPIPFNRPCFAGREEVYVTQTIAKGHISGDGSFTRKCHLFLEHELGVCKALLTTSGTHALELGALLLNIQPGDEVIIPSFTFVSTANAFVLRGARPVFIDIRQDTLNMDETLLEQLITPRTKAIVPVHYAGIGCEMDLILEIAGRHGVAVVEDNSHGLFARYRGKYLGTFGCMSVLSFHESKNFTCGEGGALLINDPQYTHRAEIIREKGTNRSSFFRGEVDKYTWLDLGSSYLPSDILAAILYAQLEARERIQATRKRLWDYYLRHLEDWAKRNDVELPTVPLHCEQPYHMFYLLMPSVKQRQALMAHLKARDIQSVFHYLPLHISDMGRNFGGMEGLCPVTEAVSERLLRLPFYNELTEADQERIALAIEEFNG